jgi:hypothetical protein
MKKKMQAIRLSPEPCHVQTMTPTLKMSTYEMITGFDDDDQ